METNWYCKLFVDTELPFQDVVRRIGVYLEGTVSEQLGHVISRSLDIDVRKNEEFDPARRNTAHPRDRFLYFRYFLDIDPTSSAGWEEYVSSISELLKKMWQDGFRAVAACDFEELLPNNGGYEASGRGR